MYWTSKKIWSCYFSRYISHHKHCKEVRISFQLAPLVSPSVYWAKSVQCQVLLLRFSRPVAKTKVGSSVCPSHFIENSCEDEMISCISRRGFELGTPSAISGSGSWMLCEQLSRDIVRKVRVIIYMCADRRKLIGRPSYKSGYQWVLNGWVFPLIWTVTARRVCEPFDTRHLHTQNLPPLSFSSNTIPPFTCC